MKIKRLVSILASVALMFGIAGCGSTKEPTPVPDTIDDNYRVFYQIFVGSFSDSDGDGLGDIRGIINRMNYLNDGNVNSTKSLGVQGIWLSPIFESPSYHKYDAEDYYRIDSTFGTEDDLKELINLCHQRNVKLILDLAINHTSSQNTWFTNFKAARRTGNSSSQYYDFYTCVTDSTKLAGHTYYAVPGSIGEYYEGNFSSDMPELNYDNEVVKTEMVKVAKHYLDMGIDGFRFDAIKYIYYNDTEKSSAFWDWYMAELKKIKSDIYTVGECWSGDSEVIEYYSALNCFNFTTSQTTGQIAKAAMDDRISSFTNYVANHQQAIKAQNPDAMYCPFIANHDTDRAAGYLDVSQKRMHMAANLYILCCGSPFIYYGEEIGMKGSRGGANTDANRRLAMLWGDKDKVKNPEGSTYSSEYQINGTVAKQNKDKNSLLNYYRKLITLRNKYPEIARGDYTALTCTGNVGGFKIVYNGSTIGLFHNTTTQAVEISLPAGAETFSEVCDFIGQGKASLEGTTLKIGPQTSVIVK